MLRVILLALSLIAQATWGKTDQDGSHIQADNYYPRVVFETTMGNFTVELDRRRAPITVNNFLRYVDKRSFEDTLFHRIIPGFVVQGGGYDADGQDKPKFPAIFNESGNGLKNTTYSIAMARQTDPHTANRQFYFNLNENTSLDPGRDWGYAVFGAVVEGSEVLDAMGAVETEFSMLLRQPDVPVTPILLKRITLLPPQ